MRFLTFMTPLFSAQPNDRVECTGLLRSFALSVRTCRCLTMFGTCAVLLAFLTSVPARAQIGTATITVGNRARAVAVNPVTNRIYVANFAEETVDRKNFCTTGSISVIDGATDATWMIPIGRCPHAVAANPVTNKIYVADQGGSVWVINGATQSAIKSIPVGNFLLEIAINPVTNKIYVTDNWYNNVAVIDGSTDTLVATVPTGDSPGPIAVNVQTNKVYVGVYGYALNSSSSSVTIIDANHNNAITTLRLPGSNSKHVTAFGVNPVTNLIYATFAADIFGNDGMMLIDGTTNATRSVEAGHSVFHDPNSIAVNPVTNTVYVANYYAGNVLAVHWPSLQTLPSITQLSVYGQPVWVAANTVTNKIYAFANFSNYVAMIDGRTNAVTELYNPNSTEAAGGLAINPLTNKVYVSNLAPGTANSTVTVYGASNITSTAVNTPLIPTRVDVDPATNEAYILSALGLNVTALNVNARTITPIAVGQYQQSIVVNPVTNKIFVSADYSVANGVPGVAVIDGAINEVLTVVPIPRAGALALNPVTNRVYVGRVTTGGSITMIDADNKYAATNINIGGAGSNPFALAVNPVANVVYVIEDAAPYNVLVVNGAMNVPIRSVLTGNLPTAAAVNPVTNTIYVTNHGSNTVTVIDGATYGTTTVPVGTGPSAVAVNPITGYAYVANTGGSSVTVIAPNFATTRVPVGPNPSSVAVNPVTNTIYVANHNGASATLIDGATNNTLTVPAGSLPESIAVNPITNTAYMTNGNSNSVSIIQEQPLVRNPLQVSFGYGFGPTDQTSNQYPTLQVTATSGFSPIATVPHQVYYQYDTWQGTWKRAIPEGAGSFEISTGSPLSPGTHILFAFATDGQDSMSATSPLIGTIASYLFLESASGRRAL